MEERNIRGVKTIFVPAEVEGINIDKSLKKIKLKEKKIGLVSSIQFVKYLDDVKEYLTQAGLVMKEKRHSEMIENSSDVCNTYNQIWWRTANQA